MFTQRVRALREHCVDGHHGQPATAAAVRRALHRHRHRAQAGDRLRDGDRDRARGADERPRRVRDRAGARAHDARGARPRAQPRDDDAAGSHVPRRPPRDSARQRHGRHDDASGSTRRVRAAGRADPRRLLQRRVLQQRPRRAARRRALARVTWQLSAKRGGWLGGIDEAVALLKLCSDDFAALEVHALYEGDRIEAWDTVLVVEGDVRRASRTSRR